MQSEITLSKNKWLLVCLFYLVLASACLKGRGPIVKQVAQATSDSLHTDFFKQTQGVTAGILQSSIELQNGQVIWLYGLAHINDWNPSTQKIACIPNVHNAAVWQQQVLNLSATQDWIPCQDPGSWYTPLHGYQFLDTLYLFLQKEGQHANQTTYIASIYYPTMQLVSIDSMSFGQIRFGHSVVVDKSLGFCYVYGMQGTAVYVARFPMNNIRAQWAYFGNDDWQDQLSKANRIVEAKGNQCCVQRVQGWFVYSSLAEANQCNLAAKLYTKVSAFPYGPFVNERLLYTIPPEANNSNLNCVSSFIHLPWIQNNNIVLTYSLNASQICANTCMNNEDDASKYRARAIHVDFSSIQSE